MRRLTVDLGALGVVLLLGAWPVAPAVAAPLPAAAQAQYLRGSQLYRQQRFAQAAQAFSAAYAQYPSSRLLYDIGQAQRKAGKASDAVTAYESFLTAETQLTPNTRGGVLAYIADLQRQLKRPVTVTGLKPKVMPDLLDPAQGLPPSAAAAVAVKAAPAPAVSAVAATSGTAAPVTDLAAPSAAATAPSSGSVAAPAVAVAAVPAAAVCCSGGCWDGSGGAGGSKLGGCGGAGGAATCAGDCCGCAGHCRSACDWAASGRRSSSGTPGGLARSDRCRRGTSSCASSCQLAA
jgi:hypothetical protein